MLPEVGALVGGRYKIERRIGEGGMAVVYEATTPEGTRLALKMLKPELAKQLEVVTRFKREARAVRKLRSPHAVRVHDVATTPEGLPFMVMELLTGRDLSAELEKRGPLPVAEAVGWVIQACVAMREAHHRRIVHRDLKPDNLFLVQERDETLIKVLDFGVSKLQDELADVTGTQAVMGTPYYMSPEQVRSTKSADARSDLWSLGVILYELLTGKVPYDGNGNIGFVMVSICIHPLPPMREARPEISPELEKAILRALEKDRDQRVQTAEELLALLCKATGLPVPPLPPLDPIGSQPEISTSVVMPIRQPRRAPTWAWALVGVGGLFFFSMVGVLIAVVLHEPPKKTVPITASTASSSAMSIVEPPATSALVEPAPVVSASATVVPSAKPIPSVAAKPTGTPNVLSRRR